MSHHVTIHTPLGPLTIRANLHGITAVEFDTTEPTPAPISLPPILAQAVTELTEYFAGCRTEFTLPLAPQGTRFQQQAWQALQQIPYGQTITYLQQALQLNNAKACRAVGSANGKNPIAIVVPCHRVIGQRGKLTGYAGGLDRKAWLLAHEQSFVKTE